MPSVQKSVRLGTAVDVSLLSLSLPLPCTFIWCYTSPTLFFSVSMPTSKQRLHLALPQHIAVFLKRISLRDDMPQATKALELLELSLEEEEGTFKESFVKEVKRRSKNDKLVPASRVLGKVWSR